MIIRSVIWSATFYCCYKGNIVTPKPSVFDNKQYVESFDTEPYESLSSWASRVAEDSAYSMGQESCTELASDFSICGVDINIKSTDEIKVPEECPEADITLYKEIVKRLEGYRKQIKSLEEGRDALRRIKERTDEQVDELRNTIKKLERLLKMESGDIDQLARLKDKCPNIEEIVKEK